MRLATRGKTARAALIAGGFFVVASVFLVGAIRLANSRTTQLFGKLVTSVATTDRVVALTFDDGPVAPYTDSILDLLRDEHVKATFFVIGGAVGRHPELARRVVEDGHELGNHSFSHDRMVFMSQGRIRREVESTDSLIRAAGGKGRIAFRPPYGKRLVGLPWYLSRTDRTTVLWTLEPDTWFRDRKSMADYVARNVRPGSIIVLHVEIPSRVEERAALQPIIADLKRRGYRFLTVSELIAH